MGVSLLALVPLVVGLVVTSLGVLGFLERLPRNRFGGVRTPATLRDDETFRVGNKVAGLPIAVAGLVGVLGGGAAFAMTGTAAVVVTVVLALLGTLVIAAAGGVLGHRAAESMPVPAPAPALPAGCKGCQCGGCDLAALKGGSVGADVAGVRGE